jgi:GNAT superfamily N-acetyltransferase
MSGLLDLMAATWPAAAEQRVGPFRLRLAPGGGNRVTCAVAEGAAGAAAGAAEAAALAAAARAAGQVPCVMLTPGEAALDARLAAAGWRMGEAVEVLEAACAALPEPLPLAAFALWPPLAIQVALWQAAGIGPARRAVMARAAEPRAAILGRSEDRAAGTAFAAVAADCAFLHALAVVPALRRRGTARQMLRAAAAWARAAGARRIAVAVTRDNAAARALYVAEGFREAAAYHYRLLPEAGGSAGCA